MISRRLAKATPGWVGPAANSAGWSVAALIPSRRPAASSSTGRRARSTSVPAPTHLMPAASRCSKVSSSASVPKSRAWLLASDTQSTPSRLSTSVATGGARKKNGFLGSGQGAPRVEMQHSKFTMVRSASLHAATTSSATNFFGPWLIRTWATPRPSIVSPASASFITLQSTWSPNIDVVAVDPKRRGGDPRGPRSWQKPPPSPASRRHRRHPSRDRVVVGRSPLPGRGNGQTATFGSTRSRDAVFRPL